MLDNCNFDFVSNIKLISFGAMLTVIYKAFKPSNTGQLASRKGSSRDAGHLPPNTGRPVKYGTSGKPSYRGGWVGELKRYVTLVLKIRPMPTDKYKYCCLDC